MNRISGLATIKTKEIRREIKPIRFSTAIKNAQPSFISRVYIIIIIRICTQKNVCHSVVEHLAIIGRWLLFRGINNHNSNNISLARCFAFRVRYSILAQNFYCHNKNWPKKKTETGFYEDRNGPLFIRLGDVDRNGLHALACVLLFSPLRVKWNSSFLWCIEFLIIYFWRSPS